jgi:hypothetical protein
MQLNSLQLVTQVWVAAIALTDKTDKTIKANIFFMFSSLI